MDIKELDTNAAAMVARGKGILAADESTGTIKKRFDKIGLESRSSPVAPTASSCSPRPRRRSTSPASSSTTRPSASRQRTASRSRSCSPQRGILPGIKVDAGAKAFAGFPGETMTEGLDGLRERLAEYRGLGARFAKWRAVIDIGAGIPTQACIAANAEALARYAALCQEATIVPIVEPEVLMDGDHGIERCEEVTDATLEAVFDSLFLHRVRLEGMVLKPNMVIAGKKSPKQAKPAAGRRGHGALPAAPRAGRGARHRLPVWWPERGARRPCTFRS